MELVLKTKANWVDTTPVLTWVKNTYHMWAQRSVTRHQLRNLDPRLLRDIGLTDHDVRRETAKPFWVE